MTSKPGRPYLSLSHPLAPFEGWALYEGQGSTLHSARRNRKAVPGSAASWTVVRRGRALAMGGSHYYEIPLQTPQLFAYPMTICAGISTNIVASSSYAACLIGNEGSGDLWGSNNETHLSVYQGYFDFYCRTSGGEHLGGAGAFRTPARPTAGRMYDVAVVVNNPSLFYLDGVQVDSQAFSGTAAFETYSEYRIGRPHDDERYWNGNIEYLYVYHRALTPAEINSIHADPYQMFRNKHALSVAATQTGGAPTTTVHLAWNDNSEGEDGFSIERDDDGGGFAVVHTTAAGVETWNDTSVPTGVTYTYRVRATSATLGNSEYSNEAEVTV